MIFHSFLIEQKFACTAANSKSRVLVTWSGTKESQSALTHLKADEFCGIMRQMNLPERAKVDLLELGLT